MRHVAQIVELSHMYKLLVGRPERKSSFGRPRCRCEGNIKMNVEGIGCETWTGLCLLHYVMLNMSRTDWAAHGLTSGPWFVAVMFKGWSSQ
jgi:hypothetical protein